MEKENTTKEADEFLKIATDFKLGSLPTESPNPITKGLAELSQTNLPRAYELFKKVDLRFLEVLEQRLPELFQLKKVIQAVLENNKRIYLCGCGATGRLSLALERIWREDFPSNDQMRSFMAGGDLALISSIEKFEDFPDYGARQLRDAGFEDGDLLISSTEGGETPWVIGATWEATKISTVKPYFLYCNPDSILKKDVLRSREVIESEKIEKINLFCGEMALAGSTRLQASSILMFGIGLSLMHFDKLDSSLQQEFERFKNYFLNLDTAQFAPLTAAESAIYKNGDFCHYLTNSHLGISILTDTTERSPTFSLHPFENYNESSDYKALAYLSLSHFQNSKEAWEFLLARKVRAVKWPEVEGIAGEKRMWGYLVGSECLELREKRLYPKTNHYFKIEEADALLSFELNSEKLQLSIPNFSTLSKHMLLKLLLNTHSTLLMGRIGRFQSNVMTYVRASNNKLIDRSVRNVSYLLLDKGKKFPFERIVYEIFKLRKNLKPDDALVIKVFEELLKSP